LRLIISFIAVAFGAIKTRLTQAPAGEFVVKPDGTKHAVGFHGGYDEEDKWFVCSVAKYFSYELTNALVGWEISL
jgi:hypothetical protein